jgi:hypothetical protein
MPASMIPRSTSIPAASCSCAAAAPSVTPARPKSSNMRAPVQLIAQGVHVLPCIGDGRQSGTSRSPSILNASPEAAVGGGLAILRTGDRGPRRFAAVRGERASVGNRTRSAI